MYCSASVSVVLSGAAKPLSRPQNWLHTTVPLTDSAASGAPPSSPRANAFMSIAYTPEQSFAGDGLPPEFNAVDTLYGAGYRFSEE